MKVFSGQKQNAKRDTIYMQKNKDKCKICGQKMPCEKKDCDHGYHQKPLLSKIGCTDCNKKIEWY
jgi:hypothetical protein